MEDALNPTWYLPAPAKLNLFLHITGVREDGYHNLQTIFQLLDYSDEVSLSLREDGVIKRSHGLSYVKEEDDLIVKAAKALQDYTNTPLGANVGVEKKLPVGGGIGGGSSDAATTLLGLDKLWQCNLKKKELLSIATKLGADVPVFVNAHSAWAEGVGEELTNLELDEKWYVVIHPRVFISTAELFSSEVLTRNRTPLRIRDFPDADNENVFESLVRKKHFEVDKSLRWLNNYSSSRMSGTGSCVFAPFESRQNALEVLDQVPEQWSAFIARAVNRSPVLDALKLHAS